MILYKYQTINEYSLSALVEKKHWYSSLSELNDPYEAYFIDNTEDTVYQKFARSYQVCCFTKSKGNILMWSHYANNHKGFCLEFDTPLEPGALWPIEYKDDVKTFSQVKLTHQGHLDLNLHGDGSFMNTKFKIWSYEEEIRTMRVVTDGNPNGHLDKHIGKLTAIYFGRQASAADINLVKTTINAHYEDVKFFKVDLNLDTMSNDLLESL